MPIYLFKNPKTGKIKEIIQSMNSEHIYFEDNIQWERVFTIPQSSIDTKIDPFSESDFKNKTAGKRETLGDLMDRSKELSFQREQSAGSDPVKKKFFENYSKERKGKIHKDDPARNISINSNIFSVE